VYVKLLVRLVLVSVKKLLPWLPQSIFFIFSGKHHIECVAPHVDNNFQSVSHIDRVVDKGLGFQVLLNSHQPHYTRTSQWFPAWRSASYQPKQQDHWNMANVLHGVPVYSPAYSDNKLYCLVTEAMRVNNLPKIATWQCSGRDCKSNASKSNDKIASSEITEKCMEKSQWCNFLDAKNCILRAENLFLAAHYPPQTQMHIQAWGKS